MVLASILSNIDWGQILGPIITFILVTIVGMVLPKVPAATKAGVDRLKAEAAKVKHEYARGVLLRLTDLVGAKVLEYENTQIEILKERAAKGELRWEDLPGLLKEMKEALIRDVKEDATLMGLWKDAVLVFNGDENALIKWLTGMTETKVAELPPSGLQTSKDSLQVPAMIRGALAE